MKYASFVTSILIVIAVLVPGSNLPDVSIGGYDKLIHFIMFFTWALAVRYDFARARNVSIIASGIVFSALTELLQILVEGRSFDFYDMAADTAGLLAGALISKPFVTWVVRKIPALRQPDHKS